MHGICATVGPGPLRLLSGTLRSANEPIAIQGRDGSLIGAVYGPVTQREAIGVVSALLAGGDPGGPDVPWLAVAAKAPRGLAAAASTMLASGVYWATAGPTLVVSSDPRSAARAVGCRVQVDPDFIRDYSGNLVPPAATPYRGVTRIPAGRTAIWDSPTSTPTVVQWCGPAQWAKPSTEGPAALRTYIEVFDTAVTNLVRRAGTVVATVSGGLDSTFVASALAGSADLTEPVLGLVAAPLPEALLPPEWNADETRLARLLEPRYPGRIVVQPVVNTQMVRPLDAAAKAARRSGVPTFNPSNQPWLAAILGIAAARGARMLFTGGHGNAAFSADHRYAADHALRGGHLGVLRQLGYGADGKWTWPAWRSQVLGPLRRRYVTRPRLPPHPLARFGVAQPPGPAMKDRAFYLDWLSLGDRGFYAAANPAAVGGVLRADPFMARAVLEVAASITPAEWQRGAVPRGFARRAGVGRVPAEILAPGPRGQQGRDAWYVIRNDRDEYLDRIAAIPEAPGLEHVDHVALGRHVATWPWGEMRGPKWVEHIAVDRLLALAEFAASIATEVGPSPVSGNSAASMGP